MIDNLEEKTEYFRELWKQKEEIKDREKMSKVKRRLSRDLKITLMKNADLLFIYNELLAAGEIEADQRMLNLLKKRAIRTLSGVAPIAILTKPYECPGNCLFCPTEKGMPKSYLSNEPAVMRAIATKFDPYVQVQTRIHALTRNGHQANKIELIVMGGTWSYFPEDYQEWFLKRVFDSANAGLGEAEESPDLATAQKINETAEFRIIGLTLETRPDYINKEEIIRMRKYGCTRVELGVQHIDDTILKENKRGHDRAATILATKLLKEAGIKVTYHMMPNLYKASPESDLAMFKELFSNPDFQPDQIKIYPTVVVKGSELYDVWQAGGFIPYSAEVLRKLLVDIKLLIPRYVRIIRLIRDIPAESIEDGNKITNLREMLQADLKKQGKICKCIRCREARENVDNLDLAELYIEEYAASNGEEKFLYWGNKEKNILYAFLRLRFNKEWSDYLPELKGAALVREVHTYGKLVAPEAKSSAVQHMGFGRRLMKKAEELAKEAGFKKMAVISGIGVREYYKKLGYHLEGTYMVKEL